MLARRVSCLVPTLLLAYLVLLLLFTGVLCPLFRQHGARDTEPWLLGDSAFTNVRKVMALRETLRPYVLQELQETARSGLPLNRPLLFDYPADSKVWSVTDQLMFGRDYLAAPIYTQGAANRTVYFPLNSGTWTHYFTNKTYAAGTTAVVGAPLDHFPLFKRGGGRARHHSAINY